MAFTIFGWLPVLIVLEVAQQTYLALSIKLQERIEVQAETVDSLPRRRAVGDGESSSPAQQRRDWRVGVCGGPVWCIFR